MRAGGSLFIIHYFYLYKCTDLGLKNGKKRKLDLLCNSNCAIKNEFEFELNYWTDRMTDLSRGTAQKTQVQKYDHKLVN